MVKPHPSVPPEALDRFTVELRLQIAELRDKLTSTEKLLEDFEAMKNSLESTDEEKSMREQNNQKLTTKCNICEVTTGQGSDYAHHRCTDDHMDNIECLTASGGLLAFIQNERHDQVRRLLEYVKGRRSDGSPAPLKCRLCDCPLPKSDEDMLIHVLGKRHLKNFNEREHKDERPSTSARSGALMVQQKKQ